MILVIDNYDSFTWNLVHYLMEMGAEVDGIDRIDTQGALRFTGNTLDLALVGKGHFTIDPPNGR